MADVADGTPAAVLEAAAQLTVHQLKHRLSSLGLAADGRRSALVKRLVRGEVDRIRAALSANSGYQEDCRQNDLSMLV